MSDARHRWATYKMGGGDERPEVHVAPLDDAIEHLLTEDCVCGPSAEVFPGYGPDVYLITHSSLDGRELNE